MSKPPDVDPGERAALAAVQSFEVPPSGNGLDIRGGGAIVVDTETLRSTAAGFVGLAGELAELSGLVATAQSTLAGERLAWDAGTSAFALYRRLTDVEAAAESVAASLREAAALYEMAELNAARAAAVLAGDSDAVARIDLRMAALEERYPMVEWKAWGAQFEYNVMWPSELVRQWTETGQLFGEVAPGVVLGGLAYGLSRTAQGLGRGTIDRTERLSGGTVDVRVRQVSASTAVSAPGTLAAATARIPSPGAGQARVRVEKYTMADGSRQFAVYVAGTKLEGPSSEAFDLASATQLEVGQRSASYDATLEALREAGAQPGDVVHAFAHSQGAMVTGHLAIEGEYDVKTLVSLGSPIEVDVGPGTLSVALRHTDDPLAMMTGGGFDHPVGAPGSFVAHRVADPASGLQDFALPAHDAAAYVQTAGMLDASTDPRMGAVRDVLDELGDAISVQATEYGAERG
jgi:hypothetical protein